MSNSGIFGRTFLVLALAVASCADGQTLPGTDKHWSLKTEDTELELGVRGDAPVVLSLRAPGSSWNWIQDANSESLPAAIVRDGGRIGVSWKFIGAKYDGPNATLTLSFASTIPSLQVDSVWHAPRGRGPIEHSLTITNRSSDVLTLTSVPSLQLGRLQAPMDKYIESTQVRRGGSNAEVQGGILSQAVSNEWQANVPSNPPDGGNGDASAVVDAASQIPFLGIQVESSHGLYVGWKFSAVGQVSGSAKDGTLGLSVGLAKDFVTDLPPSAVFRVPTAFVGTYVGDQEAGSYSIYRYVMDSLLPKPGAGPYPTLAYNYYLDGGEPGTQDEAAVLSSAALAHELGFETFVADAMWFPESGDWRWEPARFPHGAAPIARYLHDHGMKFGLWMAWTHGSRSDSDTAMGFGRHPGWFTRPPKFQAGSLINWDAQIDVGNDDARAWIRRETARAVREYGIDYLKTDHSPIAVTSLAQQQHGRHSTDVSYWSTLGYYEVQESLLRKFPGIVLESCAGGGRIKDFGNIEHAHYVVGTDTLSALADRQSLYDTSVVFPPATIQLYTYERYFSEFADAPEPYLWRSGMLGAWQIDLTQSAKLTAIQKSQIKRATEVYRTWIRPVMADAHVYRILPRPDGSHWDGMFYWNRGIKRGTGFVFRPNSDRSGQFVYLAGLDPKAMYHVRGEDGAVAEAEMSGQDLTANGIFVHLPERFTSEIVYVEAVSNAESAAVR